MFNRKHASTTIREVIIIYCDSWDNVHTLLQPKLYNQSQESSNETTLEFLPEEQNRKAPPDGDGIMFITCSSLSIRQGNSLELLLDENEDEMMSKKACCAQNHYSALLGVCRSLLRKLRQR
jgi:hypothetical protein